MDQFLFLYPIPEILDFEIEKGGMVFDKFSRYDELLKRKKSTNDKVEQEKIVQEAIELRSKEYGIHYGQKLNECIDKRYRENGFKINYAIFNGHSVSEIINLRTTDKVIDVGMDFKTHTTELTDNTFAYPDSNYILEKLGNVNKLVVAGFHLSDCVEKVAKKAYERGLDVLVDEDLTERFPCNIRNPTFQTDKYPSVTIDDELERELFMDYRKNKPWLWQEF